MNFLKTHGTGNDFVLIDREAVSEPAEGWPERARRMCDRHFGIGADGLLLVQPSSRRLDMLNPDGSIGGMCGNGLRCVALWLARNGQAPWEAWFEAFMGDRPVQLLAGQDGIASVDMGKADLSAASLGFEAGGADTFVDQPVAVEGLTFRGTGVSMGNPHLVVLVPDVDAVPLEDWGPKLENHPRFAHRTNVHFVEIAGPNRLRQRTWERGAGPTLACGSGACAAAVAAMTLGLTGSRVAVGVPGGELRIEVGHDLEVRKTGPAEIVFSGVWPD